MLCFPENLIIYKEKILSTADKPNFLFMFRNMLFFQIAKTFEIFLMYRVSHFRFFCRVWFIFKDTGLLISATFMWY